MKGIVLACLLVVTGVIVGQSDSVVLSNGDVIEGEIKEMTKSVLTIETDYSDSDFKIEWDKVRELHSKEVYTINLSDRSIFVGATIETVAPGRVRISGQEGVREVPIINIVYLRELEGSFWSKLSASIDVGYSVTKANNLQQYTADAKIGYKSERWTLKASSRQVRSSQDSVAPIQRIEASLSGDYSLNSGIFFGSALDFLSNSEQNLKLRTTGTVGSGYYFVRTNSWLLNSSLGVAINNEEFDQTAENVGTELNRESYEGAFGILLDLYDVGDLGLYSDFKWYPSFTEKGRNRIDYEFTLKYDLPLDFYIKTGLTLNYDSNPSQGSSKSDYVVLTGFGWEL